MIKGIFHPHWKDFEFCKKLGFTHVEIAIGVHYQNYSEMKYALEKCHQAGLNAFINAGFDKTELGSNEEWDVIKFLQSLDFHESDLIFICDEPNDRKISKNKIKHWVKIIDLNNDIRCKKTLITLTASEPWQYANLTNIVAIDYYRDYKKFDLFMLWLKMKYLRRKHKGQIFGIPGIKGPPEFLQQQYEFWKKCKVDGLIWYSFTPDQDSTNSIPWLPGQLDSLPLHSEVIRNLNARD